MTKSIVVAIALLLAPSAASAQWVNYPTPGIPRTADGKPDLSAPAPRGPDGKPNLSGIWTRSAVAPGWDLRKLRESGAFTDQNLTYHRPPDASIPFQPWAEALFRERQARNGAGARSERCLPTGIPEATLEPPPFKIAQMNGLTIILFESFNRYRQIRPRFHFSDVHILRHTVCSPSAMRARASHSGARGPSGPAYDPAVHAFESGSVRCRDSVTGRSCSTEPAHPRRALRRWRNRDIRPWRNNGGGGKSAVNSLIS